MSEGFRSDVLGSNIIGSSEPDHSDPCEVPGADWQPIHLPFRPRLRAADEPFAHPFETAFAQMLTDYRVRWSYEPTTFPIRWDDQRRPVEFITPDFYLPDHRLYVELTTMRQRLVTRKHRKVRLLRALYPNVQIKVLYRRDYLRLVMANAGRNRFDDGETGETLLDRETIVARLGEMARDIAHDLGDDAATLPLLLACGAGGRRVLDDLSPMLRTAGLAFEADTVTVRRVSTGLSSAGGSVTIRRGAAPILNPSGRQDAGQNLCGRRVLVVHGIVSSGLSADHLARWLRRRGASQVLTLACLDRRSARVVDVPLRYVGFEVPADLLVGYGLDLRRTYRDAPFVATYRPFDGDGAMAITSGDLAKVPR